MLDPRYDMGRLVELTEQAFELSEAARLPVIMSLRIRAAHMTGSFTCKDNRAPEFSPHNPLPGAIQTTDTIVLPAGQLCPGTRQVRNSPAGGAAVYRPSTASTRYSRAAARGWASCCRAARTARSFAR